MQALALHFIPALAVKLRLQKVLVWILFWHLAERNDAWNWAFVARSVCIHVLAWSMFWPYSLELTSWFEETSDCFYSSVIPVHIPLSNRGKPDIIQEKAGNESVWQRGLLWQWLLALRRDRRAESSMLHQISSFRVYWVKSKWEL